MDHPMFCRPRGKTAETAALQERLTGALIGLARSASGVSALPEETSLLVQEALFASLVNVDNAALEALIARVHAEKNKLAPDCAVCGAPCGRTADYELKELWNAPEDVRSLKFLILFGIRGMAACAYHAAMLGCHNAQVNDFFYKALFIIGEDREAEQLLPVVLEMGKYNLTCMELPGRASAVPDEDLKANPG